MLLKALQHLRKQGLVVEISGVNHKHGRLFKVENPKMDGPSVWLSRESIISLYRSIKDSN